MELTQENLEAIVCHAEKIGALRGGLPYGRLILALAAAVTVASGGGFAGGVEWSKSDVEAVAGAEAAAVAERVAHDQVDELETAVARIDRQISSIHGGQVVNRELLCGLAERAGVIAAGFCPMVEELPE